jgi:hypothetical protein
MTTGEAVPMRQTMAAAMTRMPAVTAASWVVMRLDGVTGDFRFCMAAAYGAEAGNPVTVPQ